MNRLSILAIIVILLAVAWPAGAEDWKPAAGPLMTRWAKDVSPDNAHPEYPRPQMVRSRWLNLNGLWQLDAAEADDAVPAGKELPRQILVPYPVESALSGVMRAADRVWYRRTFEVPGGWNGQRVMLHFQAVDWEAVVYVNGKQVGIHRGGYDPFCLDITDALNPSGDQELIVKVFDPSSDGDQPRGKQVKNPRGIWYTPTTGIWQTVWLEPVPATRIGRVMLVPDVDGSCLRLTVEGIGTGVENTVLAVARDGDGEVGRAFGGVGAEIKLNIPQDKLKLWSPADPKLYDLSVTLKQGEMTVDEVESYFGMRKIELAKDADGRMRMRLNGEFLFQMGPLDQGFWPDGLYTAPTDEALRYDIEVTRRLGFNMTRKHVKIEPQRWYYWCDKLGLLVWQDMPSGNNNTPESKLQFETELRQMVGGLCNHPSIIMWVVFNEGWGQHDTERYVAEVKKMDPSRLVNNASGWTDKTVGDVLDIHKYPGPAAPKPEANRAGVLGEFGGLGLGVDGHTWTEKTWGYRGTADSEELTRRYQNLLRGVWQFQSQGMSAAVYTQITDVETECNGLLTYDREVIKPNVKKVAAANRGQVPKQKIVVPTSKLEAVSWRYTLEKPADDWYRSDFDDSAWKEGPGGFGTERTPGAAVRTAWDSQEIWLRRQFELPQVKTEDLLLLVHHDEDVEIYLNGVLAARAAEFTIDYEELSIRPEALRTLRPGKNVMAVHCQQTQGGQYIDVGVVELSMDEEE
ncbi:MAG: glycoside hydrolase family 2 [Pirellulales bacterium]|nr:glycoside hydrolase family 2 [Pirellulales bacterium]